MTKEEASKELQDSENTEKSVSVKVKASINKDENLDKMVLDSDMNKYDLILLARRWAYELKSQSEQSLSIQELINRSLDDILSGRVTHKTIQSLPPISIVKKQKSHPLTILENIGKTPSSESSSEKTKTSGNNKKGK